MQARIHVYETLRGDIIKRKQGIKKRPAFKSCQAPSALYESESINRYGDSPGCRNGEA
jgi:hypothetical protein